jgi:hypothetical protein
MYECFANANLTRVRHNRQCFGPTQTDSEYTVYSLQAILGIRFSTKQSFSLQSPTRHYMKTTQQNKRRELGKNLEGNIKNPLGNYPRRRISGDVVIDKYDH